MMADARIQGNRFKVVSPAFYYNDDYGINSDLKVYAEKAGFLLSGGFERYKATTWRIEVSF